MPKREVRWLRFGLVFAMQLATILVADRASAVVLVSKELLLGGALEDLRSGDPRLRANATVRLAEFPEAWERTASALLLALSDPESSVRAGAARAMEAALAVRSDDAAVAALVDRLGDSSYEVRAASAFALWRAERIPPSAAAPLAVAFTSDSPGLRIASSVALVKHFPESEALRSDRVRLASEAVGLARRVVDEESKRRARAPEQVPCGEASRLEESAADLAGRFGAAAAFLDPHTGVVWLNELVQRFDSGWSDAVSAARAMAPYLAEQRASWRTELTSRNAATRRVAALSVGLAGAADLETQRALVRDVRGATETSADAARALGLLGVLAKPVVPDLQRALLESRSPDLRRRIAWALIEIDWRSVEPVAKELQKSDPELAAWLRLEALRSQL